VTWTYVLAEVGTKALPFVRRLIGDTKTDRPQLQDEEIAAQLALVTLTVTSDPIANATACYGAAAECARMIAAKFSSESEIVLTPLGMQKSTAAAAYLAIAAALDRKVASGAGISFADPGTYETTWVDGVDPVPDEEAG